MTLLGYFNSLRELGGSRRIVEDEVSTRLTGYADPPPGRQAEGPFADRQIAYEAVELTSRVSTAKVAEAKRRLALAFHENDRVDVAIATNMISVGLDITRLGLMVVLGQPKTSAEYIQATSRVGRDAATRPGRDAPQHPQAPRPLALRALRGLPRVVLPQRRGHERHAVLAPGARPGLAGTLVALARQGHGPMTPAMGAAQILQKRSELDMVAARFADRASDQDAVLTPAERQAIHASVQSLCGDLLDDWLKIARQAQQEGSSLQYQKETVSAPRRLLYDFLDPELANLHRIQRRFSRESLDARC